MTITSVRFGGSRRGAHLCSRGRGTTLNNRWNCRQRGGDGGIVSPPVEKGARGGAVTFSGKIEIDVHLPGQNGTFVTLEVVRTHVRMEVTPVVVGNRRVSGFVGGVVVMTKGADVGSKRWSLDARKTGHTTELLSRGWFWGFELSMNIIGGRGSERERLAVRAGTGERCADVLFPKFAKITEFSLPGGDSRSGRELIRYIYLSEVHEHVLSDDVLPVVIGKEWSAVRGDAGNDVRVVEAHETKSRGETLLIIGFAGVGMCG